MDGMEEIQQHIRQWGGVVTSFNLYEGFRESFSKGGDKVYEPTRNAKVVERHAIVLVGYDNTGEYWIPRNSWGTGWGDQGFFKVRYYTADVGNPQFTFGITWQPQAGPFPKRMVLEPGAGQVGCYWYKVRQGDYVSKIAASFQVSIESVLQANGPEVIPNPELFLQPGIKLRVCNPYADIVLHGALADCRSGWNRKGRDLGNYISVSNQDECARLCLSTRNCEFFVYNTLKECWLKAIGGNNGNEGPDASVVWTCYIRA